MIRQFDVCELRRRRPGGVASLVVVLQHGVLDDLSSMIVAPLDRRLAAESKPRLHPEIEIGGDRAFLIVERMAAIDRKELGVVVDSVKVHADAIKRAIDITFFGF